MTADSVSIVGAGRSSGQSSRPQLLVVGGSAAAEEAVALLEPDGVTTIVAANETEAVTRHPAIMPDLVVLHEAARDGTTAALVRQLRSSQGEPPAVVVLLDSLATDGATPPWTDPEAEDEQGREFLPVALGGQRLADHLRSRLRSPAKGAARRAALTPSHRLGHEIERELHRSARSGRPGLLAVVTVAEWDQLHRALGSQAEHALEQAFGEWASEDADILEQFGTRDGGGFVVLMPEVGLLVGRERLLSLSRRIAGTVLDIGNEHVRVTPVVGYASFTGAGTADELQQQAGLAAAVAGDHLDLLPVQYTAALAAASVTAPSGKQDRFLALVERLRSPLQIAFTGALLLCVPFIVYVVVWDLGFDLTRITYPLVALALAITATVLWVECFRAAGEVDLPPPPEEGYPTATAIIAAYLPNEAATIVDTVVNMLSNDYPGDLQVILAYNSPQWLPVEETLARIAADDPRLLLLRVETSTSKAQNVNAALARVRGEFVGVFDADHHPVDGSFSRAWRWLASGHDIVQGHCVVRNGEASWVARLIAVEFETIYAVSHPGRARLHGFGIFGGSNGYWRSESLRRIRMHGAMLTEDIDSSMRSLLDGYSIVSDPGLLSTELAPTTLKALWNQRMRWAQGWTQTAIRHLRPALSSPRLSLRQKAGATFLLGWTQTVPWVTVQVLPILAFTVWRDHGISSFNFLIPLFVLLTIYTISVGLAQTVFAYVLSDEQVRRHKWWYVAFAVHSMFWFGEFKNVISRVAQLKEFIGERQWRVTPRAATSPASAEDGEAADDGEHSLAI